MKNLQVASCFILVKGLFSPLKLGEQLFIVCYHLYNMPWEVKPIKIGCGLISVVVWELKKNCQTATGWHKGFSNSM